jgi:glutamate-1-semialdehyde 2,1-aminomutase
VYQAGTLSGNPLAMAAGIATLKHLRAHPEIYSQLEWLTAELVKGLGCSAQNAGVSMQVSRAGSMFTCFFADIPVSDWTSAAKSDTKKFGCFHRAMLEHGIYLPPSQFETCMVSAAHGEEEIKKTLSAAKEVFAALG